MSEQILERTASSAGPIPGDLGESGTPESAKGTRSRTFLIVALAVVVGLVLGGLALFMMQPSSDEAEVPLAAPGTSAGAGAPGSDGTAGAEAAEGEAAGEAEAEAAAPKKSTARLTSRDPFAPLIAKKPVAPPPPVKVEAVAPAPAPVPAPVAADIPAPSTPATGGTISALAISPLGNEVTLKLDGKKYTVEEGEAFAKSYRLYDIFNDSCAGFLYGDRNAVVCEGDSVTIG